MRFGGRNIRKCKKITIREVLLDIFSVDQVSEGLDGLWICPAVWLPVVGDSVMMGCGICQSPKSLDFISFFKYKICCVQATFQICFEYAYSEGHFPF